MENMGNVDFGDFPCGPNVQSSMANEISVPVKQRCESKDEWHNV
jgi:hypothetical protein